MALIVKDRYAGEAARTEWFEICSVAGCGAGNAAKLRKQIENAMLAQLARYGFSAEDAAGDDPVAFFDGYFKPKGSRDTAGGAGIQLAYEEAKKNFDKKANNRVILVTDGDKSILIEKAHTAAEMTRKEPSADFRFASAIAEFALILENSKHKGDASFAKLIERARRAKGEDREGYRAEFIRLAESAEVYLRF